MQYVDYIVDWGKGRKFVAKRRGAKDPLPCKNIFDLIALALPGEIIGIESTFESKEAELRNQAIDLAAAKGVVIRTLRPSITATYRKLWKLGDKPEGPTGDWQDACLLERIAKEAPAHWSIAQKAEVREPSLKQKSDKMGGRGLTKLLGSYRKASSEMREALGNGSGYDKATRTFAIVAQESDTRDGYLKAVGCSGSGRPGYARATFYRRVRTLAARALGCKPKVKKWSDVPIEEKDTAFRAAQKKLHFAIRQLYYKISCPAPSETA